MKLLELLNKDATMCVICIRNTTLQDDGTCKK